MKWRIRRKPRRLQTLPWPHDLSLELATAMEYLSEGLLPPPSNSSWNAPHGPEGPCNIPREARRKFRKKWRRGLEHLKRTTLGKSMAQAHPGPGHVPSIRNEQLRRAVVLDEMVGRAKKRLQAEQPQEDEVES